MTTLGALPVSEIDALSSTDGLSVIYDGACPFCASYVRLSLLREATGHVRLLDARDEPDLCRELKSRGFDLDDGMVVIYEGRVYHAADALRLLAKLSTQPTVIAKLARALLGDHARARRVYPILRAGRNLTLRVLGRRPIHNVET